MHINIAYPATCGLWSTSENVWWDFKSFTLTHSSRLPKLMVNYDVPDSVMQQCLSLFTIHLSLPKSVHYNIIHKIRVTTHHDICLD